MNNYDPKEIEKKWQEKWSKAQIYTPNLADTSKKYYLLIEFTYPSGDLHMGHWFTFAVPDILARMKRMQGFNVFFPNGFDAFGLPAENAAIKRGIHPQDWTLSNVEKMKSQFAQMGASFDWSHEVITCLPNYYKWNQWIFLKMFEKGIAYRGKTLSNWCPLDQCVLANENVENGKCWRCGTEVIQKEVDQWFLKITEYAERLLWKDQKRATGDSQLAISKDSNSEKRIARGDQEVDWPKSLIEAQNNWIGKSEGAIIKFTVHSSQFIDKKQTVNRQLLTDSYIEVFTTRPDTLFGATFLVLAPEHLMVKNITTKEYQKAVETYQKQSAKKSEIERKTETKEKSGQFTGAYAINPINNQSIPIYIADYVLMGYGTGAIMAVPGHDQRDFEFAKKHGLEIREVIRQSGHQDIRSSGYQAIPQPDNPTTRRPDDLTEAYEGEGILINSGQYDNLHSKEASARIIDDLEKADLATKTTNYHIHDWSVSRQRYWGTPIPMIHCSNCGIVPVPEKDLPVELPYDVDYAPRGKPPLATAEDWVKVKCPKCGRDAKRDVETMDGFVDSSWYFIRYLDPDNDRRLADRKLIDDWLPVDVYVGGAEHTLGHTMYSRFFIKFLNDIGEIGVNEYAKRRVHHGVILGPDGSRMSKSKGNVVNPDDQVVKYGADAVRMYLAFLGPYDLVIPWNPDGINGLYRYLQRVWQLFQGVHSSQFTVHSKSKKTVNRQLLTDDLFKDDLRMMHKTIKKVTEDVEGIKFNTAIAALMEWLNYLSDKVNGKWLMVNGNKTKDSKETMNNSRLTINEIETYLKLLAPFAPHMAEELWQRVHSSEFIVDGKSKKQKSISYKLQAKNWSIHLQPWPKYDPKLITAEKVLIVVQVNGKMRDKIEAPAGLSNSKIKELAQNSKKVTAFLKGAKIVNSIVVPGKLVNLVTD